MHLSHLCLSPLRITVASDARSELRCFLFHEQRGADELQDYELCRLVAVRLLAAFAEAYTTRHGVLIGSLNKASYSAFTGKLLEVITDAKRDVLRKLRMAPGVVNCVVVRDEPLTGKALGHRSIAANTEFDELAFLASSRSFATTLENFSLSPTNHQQTVRENAQETPNSEHERRPQHNHKRRGRDGALHNGAADHRRLGRRDRTKQRPHRHRAAHRKHRVPPRSTFAAFFHHSTAQHSTTLLPPHACFVLLCFGRPVNMFLLSVRGA